MFLSKLSVNRPVTVTVIILVFVIFGALAYMGMNLESIPSIDLPYVSITTIYPGADPSIVETQVTNKIEDAVSTVSMISYIQSYSMDNVSMVMIEFDLGKDVDIANQEVKDKVDAIINELPTDVEKPVVAKLDISARPVITMVLSGTQSGLELYEYADKTLRDRLSQIEGVASVNISGGQEREIQVEVGERTVFANNLSLTQLAQILAMHNMDMPAGTFKQGNQEVSVKVKGELTDVQMLREIEVPTAFGMKKLSELATIKDAGAEVSEKATLFIAESGELKDNVINIDLVKASDGNAVEISNNLQKQLAGIIENLPAGMELTIINDDADFVDSTVKSTLNTLFLGVIFTGLVLLFFLHDLRSTIIVAISMPVSIISTFTFMSWSGFTINMMSLLGLSTAVGVLVTNSVVVIENIFRHKELGENKKDSAEIGTSEIAVAVLASAMTNIVVFVPIGMMGGIIGQMLKPFGMTVAYATMFSILVAFTITPMLASLILPAKQRVTKLGERIEGWMTSFENAYKRTLNRILKSKKSSRNVILAIILLFFFSLYVASHIGFEFSPPMDQGDIRVYVELPVGYNLDQTAETLKEIEDRIHSYPELKYIITNLGKKSDSEKGLNMAYMSVKLVDASERDVSTNAVGDRMIRDLSTVPNAKITVLATSSMGGSTSAIQLFVSGLEDEPLTELANEVVERIQDVPGLINLDTSIRDGRPEITIAPKRDQLAITGDSVMEVAMAVRAAMEGVVSTQYKEHGNEYDIVVTMPEEAYNSPEKIKNLTIVTSRGKYQLSQLADVYFSAGVNRIIHRDKSKTVLITGDPATGVPMGNVTGEIERRLADINMPDGYSWAWAGNAEMQKDSVSEMGRAAILAVLLTYLLLAAILESFIQPLLIASTIPLGLIGVFFIVYIVGLTMNIVTMMAIIMLVGIVVNNAILILDYTNQLIREKGMSVHDALLEAAPTKLKPIVMSNIAIILGMLPMAMGGGSSGAEFRQAMGVSSIGGIISSTLLTLYFIPTLYFVTTKDKKR